MIPSPHPGELRWSDIKPFVDASAVAIDVVVLDPVGTPVGRTVQIGARWAGGGWARMFECPRCGQVASVLRLCDGELLCARCRPHRTQRQREHNTRRWRVFNGGLEDKLLRTLKRAELDARSDQGKLSEMADELAARDMACVAAASETGDKFVRAIDSVLEQMWSSE